MTLYAHAGDPLGDYRDHAAREVLDTRTLAQQAARARDAALVEAIRVRLAPPFRPHVHVLYSPDRPDVLTLVIGDRPGGYVRADVDGRQLTRHGPDAIAEALLKAGQYALRAAGIEPEPNIVLGEE